LIRSVSSRAAAGITVQGNDPEERAMSLRAAAYPAARVLIVDDEGANLRLLERILARAGYTSALTTERSSQALALLDGSPPDIVLLDLHMPEMDGLELMAAIRNAFPAESYLPFVILTADVSSQTRDRALASGAMDFITKPFEVPEVLLRIGNLLHTRALHQELRLRNEELELRVRERTRQLDQARVDLLVRLALAAEFRDDATGEHARRVGAMAGLLARELGMPTQHAEIISRAAMLHDVGKIGIPDYILLKPEPLTPDEFAVMRTHTEIGRNILMGSPAPTLQVAEAIAYAHHERWDGRGYHGMVGGETPIAARIVVVADTWDVLINDRPYRRAWPLSAAMQEMMDCRATQFDPTVLDAFLELIRRGELPLGTSGLPTVASPPL
jgi:putative two-component system response regulator